VGMGESREDAAFTLEAFFTGTADQRRIEELDRNLAFETAVAAASKPHAAHAALPDRSFERVCAKRLPRQRSLAERRTASEEAFAADRVSLVEERLQIRGDRGLPRAQRFEPGRTLAWRQVERLIEIRTNVAQLLEPSSAIPIVLERRWRGQSRYEPSILRSSVAVGIARRQR
jgi:hypothetical protein